MAVNTLPTPEECNCFAVRAAVCIENLIRFDCVTESHSVGDGVF
jgi:hypothetical protein